MKIPQCYFNVKLRLGQKKKCLIVHLSEAKKCKGTYKVLHLCICCSCTEKCHIAENAYQNETNIK